MRAEFTKFGPKHDYRGAHVTLTIKDRTYLGEITNVYYEETTGCVLAAVRHFNGEEWEMRPCLRALEILERTYE